MRTDCKNYESRTYPTGETVRKCNIDLAPEAPWRCPENCAGFAPRLADVNWAHGDLLSPPTPPEPPGLGEGAAELLDAAEDVVRPYLHRWPKMDRNAIVQGWAGVYSSFLLHAERAGERYQVPAHEILRRCGELGFVGGQEDMIIDIALELAREREQG